MQRCGIGLALLCLFFPLHAFAQASPNSRAEILRKLIAEVAAARIDMPFGGEGVQLSDQGEVNQGKLLKQLQKKGKSVQTGRVVAVTHIDFSDKRIDIELDGGGKEKKGLGGHVQVSVGGTSPVPQNAPVAPKVLGSKISLIFGKKIPADLNSDQLKQMISPVLDFNKRTISNTSIESLPTEFKEAVQAKEARIGMDENTVLLALGRPDQKTTEKVDGVEQEVWRYDVLGRRKTFVTFEKSIVVKVTEY